MEYPRHAKPADARSGRRATISYWVAAKGQKTPWGWGRLITFGALPLLGLLLAIATPWAVSHIEDQLVVDARADLVAAGIDIAGLEIDFDYRDGEATGVLPVGVDPAMVVDAVDDGLLRDFTVAAIIAAPSPTPEPQPTATPAAVGVVEVQAAIDAGRVVLSGEVLTEDHRSDLVAVAADLVGEANVDDQLTVSGFEARTPGADGRVADLADAIARLGVPGPWTADLTDTRLDITATVAGADAALLEALPDTLTSVPTTVTLTPVAASVAAEVVALQAELDALAAEIRETVVFELGSVELSAAAAATLDRVADAMARYRLPVVEVAGHTDNRGPADLNRTLSQERADAVASYLRSQGVAAERLTSRGAGDTEPIDTNDTDAGRARNRRVALTALESF